MATWKKVIVSGSTAAFTNVVNDGIADKQVVVGAGQGSAQVGKALTAGQILMGNASAVPTGTSVSGDISLSNTGVATIGSDKVTTAMLSGSAADTPVAGQTVKVGSNGAFTFDDASTLLSAGLGVTITNNKISSSIANPGSVVENPGNSFGTVATTEFSGSFTGSLVGLADNATNATNVNLSDNEDTDENNVLVFGAGASATGNTALETDGDLTYNPGKSRLSVPQVTASAGFKGDVTGNVTGNLTGTVQTAAQANITSVGTLTSLDVSGDVQLGNATTDTVTVAGNLIVEGTTTEVQTTNLNIEDSLIMLASGSSTADTTAAAKDTGILFAGSRIGVSQDQVSVNRGSALFVDKTYQRLSVLANGTFAASSTTTIDCRSSYTISDNRIINII